jgi:hypothetical protein
MPADMHEYTSVYVALVQNVSSVKAENCGVGPSHASLRYEALSKYQGVGAGLPHLATGMCLDL